MTVSAVPHPLKEMEAVSVTVFVDECGYTGPDLLNSDQPVFGLASIRLSERECRALRSTYFAKTQAKELKYSSLGKTARGQRGIVGFLSDFVADPTRIRIALVHKKYALVAKMVDILAEPAVFLAGGDIYSEGGNIALSNLIHTTFPVFYGNAFGDVLSRFQSMMRRYDSDTSKQFVESLSTWPELV
jgi:hypothetical protein